ncbi:MAG: hypothetical protein RIS29_553 [Bacteroidota bacterium]|jgi:polysaccharide export outer membrane protein
MRKKLFQIFLLLILIFQLPSCITTRQTNYLQSTSKKKATFRDSLNYQDYKLKEGDRLFIQVYALDGKTASLFNGSNNMGMQLASGNANSNASDLYTYLIQPDGTILFPIIGKISLQNKTLRDAKRIIQDSIKPILKLNSVDVRLVSKTFSVIGAGRSGRFNIPKEKINILQAIAMCGDLGLYADRSKIKLMRQTEKGVVIKTFDIRNTNIINSEYYYIEPDDVIFLQPLNAQFFGVTSLWTGISTVLTTISFATGIYGILTVK